MTRLLEMAHAQTQAQLASNDSLDLKLSTYLAADLVVVTLLAGFQDELRYWWSAAVLLLVALFFFAWGLRVRNFDAHLPVKKENNPAGYYTELRGKDPAAAAQAILDALAEGQVDNNERLWAKVKLYKIGSAVGLAGIAVAVVVFLLGE
jgi:hypothetical protein